MNKSILFILCIFSFQCLPSAKSPDIPDIVSETASDVLETSVEEETTVNDVSETEEPAESDNSEISVELPENEISFDAEEEIKPQTPFDFLCKECSTDENCGNSGACLKVTGYAKKFCGIDCSKDSKICPDGFYCGKVSETVVQCVPIEGNCDIFSLGLKCSKDTVFYMCQNNFPVCSVTIEGIEGYCTKECTTDEDCVVGFHRCMDRDDGKKICRADFEKGPEGCGRILPNETGTGHYCKKDGGECKSISGEKGICLADILQNIPETINAFCTLPCTADSECGTDASCAKIPGIGMEGKICVPSNCMCLVQEDPEKTSAYEIALKEIGLHKCTNIFSRKTWKIFPQTLVYDPFRLNFFNEIHDYPPSAVPFAKETSVQYKECTDKNSPVSCSIKKSAELLDHPVTKDALDEYATDKTSPLAKAVHDLITESGGSSDFNLLTEDAGDVPLEIQEKAAKIIYAIKDAAKARKEALKSIENSPNLQKSFYNFTQSFVLMNKNFTGLNPTLKSVTAFLNKNYGYEILYTSAWQAAGTIENSGLISGSYKGFSFNQKTPIGRIIINDDSDNLYDPSLPEYEGDIAFILDTGGNDIYKINAGGNSSFENPVSILIDLAGDDIYGYEETGAGETDPNLLPADQDGRYVPADTPDKDNGPISFSDRPRQGAGRLGTGMLFDLGSGKDIYKSLRMSQGFGVLGVGVLYDDGGENELICEAGCQGAGIFGMGILIAGTGNDKYTAFSLSQGFAYARGLGILIDRGGDDNFLSIPGDKNLNGTPLYYNPQNPGKSNSSMSQGFGFGRRADMSDGVYMSGGLGILLDEGGIDNYYCDIFCQGGGYWFGTGILYSMSGEDDVYEGRWYMQGAGAHFASGIFVEEGGNDKYNQTIPVLNAAVGMGHDISIGLFIDEQGNDTYKTPGLALGGGNDNGIGIFVENGGDDTYSAGDSRTFGWGGISAEMTSPRWNMLCTGTFLDVQGTDSYYRPDFNGISIQDNSVWTDENTHPVKKPLEKGAGVDNTDGFSGFTTVSKN